MSIANLDFFVLVTLENEPQKYKIFVKNHITNSFKKIVE